jgi:3-oxoacyl-[acyl-carrier-protein] synthase II
MADAPRETWITGVGILSSLGEGPDAHWQALDAGKINVETKNFAPYIVHPLAPVNFDTQIPKKGDQRQMEPWQRIGTYAAGLALDISSWAIPNLRCAPPVPISGTGRSRNLP